LRDELALIDEARTELAGGSAASALQTLGRYDTRYPQGIMREEATAVRVEALYAAGKTAEARSVGEAFLREHPASTHAQHVRSLLDAHAAP
jgi:outer membrane protein assembly factor BamD (BamD/ComL family)